MYSLDQFKKACRQPSLIPQEIQRQYQKKIQNPWNRRLNSKHGIRFLEADWDNLILLDGCRYDLFKAENTIDGELSAVRSNASSSDEFFEKNIERKKYGDLVYYSANPHIDNIQASFFDLYRLWEDDWDEETGTVLPGDAVDRVLNTMDDYEDKRIILHLMQPHRPFLGRKTEDFDQSGLSRIGVQRKPGERPEVEFWWNRMEAGELQYDDIWPLYRETLQVALPHVERLVSELSGKTVVSADHGNAFGEDELYGHPSYVHHKKLVTIPWLAIEKPRKEIISESADVDSNQEHYDEATDRLEALGYLS